MTANAQQVLAIERRFWEESSPELFQDHFADDGICIFEPMPALDKSGAIAMAKKSKPFVDVDFEDVRIQELTPDCVTISYHGKGKHLDGEPYSGSLSSVYVKRNDTWQMALTVHQPWDPKQAT